MEPLATARYTFQAMGGPASLQLPAPRSSHTDALARQAIQEVLRIEAKYSRYRADSVIGRINAAAGGDPIECDEETLRLLRFADHLWRSSEGRFDATSGVLRRAWNFRGGTVPTQSDIDALLPLVNWQQVHWVAFDNSPIGHVRLAQPGMELDFGGFGKEYAADRAAHVLRNAGVRHALVELAGDLVAIGPRPDGTPWQIGVRHPRKPLAVLATVPLANGALATSGDSERYIEAQGRRYGHVLDARTGWPVDHWQSVSIMAPTCLAAGATATLALLHGRQAQAVLNGQYQRGLFVDQAGEARSN